jgi:hypothetical protein
VLRKRVLSIVMMVLFALTIATFPLDSPYWWVSILTFTCIVFIALLKIMTEISGWVSSRIDPYLSDEKVTMSITIEELEKI